MSKCPFCNADLTDEAIDKTTGEAKCHACGKLLPSKASPHPTEVESDAQQIDQTLDSVDIPLEPGDKTVGNDQQTIDQTFDSVDLPVPKSAADSDSDEERTISQTLDSVDIPIESAEEASLTLPNRRIDETMDSTELPSDPQQEGGGTVHDRSVAQTIDIDGMESVDPPRTESGTLHQRQIAETFDSDELSPEMVERVNATWSGNISAGAGSHTSIKADAIAPRQSKSILVIQTRAFEEKSKGKNPNADYNIIDLLGEGGMGMVYAARQASIDRTVAIKMLKPDTSSDKVQRDKFLSEAVVTGELEHPNIVPIYDLGSNDQGALFYSMKRVVGTPWMNVIKKKSLYENIEILMKVADAVAFAHARDIVHRDLKPENVMLGGFGEVLLMDWGLAVPSDGRKIGGIAQSVSMGGTPAYMAPEMATGPFKIIGFPSDIYLLGAILYEIVTDNPPHTGKDVMKCLFAAAKNRIVPTDKKGELVEIALTAMATDQADRYSSVLDFQNAIRDYLSHSESIAMSTRAAEDLEQAKQSDDYQDFARSLFGYQEAVTLWDKNEKAKQGLTVAGLAYAGSALRKEDFDLGLSLLDKHNPDHISLVQQLEEGQTERNARQRRLTVAKRIMTVGVIVFLVVVSGASFWIWMAMNEAQKQQKIAEKQTVKAVIAREDADEEAQKARVAEGDARTAEGVARVAEKEATESAKIAKEEKAKAVIAQGEAEIAQREAEYEAYVALIGLAAAKIEENALGTASDLLDQCSVSSRNWEWGRLKYMCGLSLSDYKALAPVDAIAYSPDGAKFITGGWKGLAIIWDAESGKTLVTINHGPLNFVYAVAFSPDGKTVATGSNDPSGYLKIWDAESGELVKNLKGHGDSVTSVMFSKDGKTLLSGSYDSTAKLWDVESGEETRELHGHRSWVWSAAFSPDEKQVVTAGQDGVAIVWSLNIAVGEKGEQSPPFRGHQGPIYTAIFSPDGQKVVSGGYDKRILIWRPDELSEFEYAKVVANELKEVANKLNKDYQQPEEIIPPKFQALDHHTAAVRSLTFFPDGKRILSSGHDNTLKVWDAATGSLLKTLRGHNSWVRCCAFSPDGKTVLSGSHDRLVKRWDIEHYEEVRRIPRRRVLQGHSADILSAAFSTDGLHIVTASRDRTAKTWDFNTALEEVSFEEGHAFLASNVVFFPGGKKFITGAVDNTARVWNVATGTELLSLRGTGLSAAVAISPDGKWVLTGSNEQTAKLWELDKIKNRNVRTNDNDRADQKEFHSLGNHQVDVTAVAFSADGQMMLTGDSNGRCNLWDFSTRKLIHSLRAHTGRINNVAFTPDGKRVLTASSDNTVAQWNLETGREQTRLVLKHGFGVTSMALSTDGKWTLTSCADGKVRLWDTDRAIVIRTLVVKSPKITIVKKGEDEGKKKFVGLINSVAISHDGQFALTVNSEAQSVRLWDLQTGSEVEIPATDGVDSGAAYLDFSKLNLGRIWAAGFSPDDTQLVTVGGDNARLWDRTEMTRPEREHMVFIPHSDIASASFSPDGLHIVTSSFDNSARIWNAQTGRDEMKLDGQHGGNVNSATYSPDGKSVLTASDDGKAILWDASTGEVIRKFEGHQDAVNWAVFSPDGQRVLTASNDTTTRIWDVATGKLLQTLKGAGEYEHGHRYGVLRAAFSADGLRVVTGSEDTTAKVWDLATGKVVLSLEGHTAAVTSVTFSPDGERILTGSEDFTAKIWDANKQDPGEEAASVVAESNEVLKAKEILTLKGHNQGVTSVSFTADGIYALTGSRDGTAIVWLATGEWKQDLTMIGQSR